MGILDFIFNVSDNDYNSADETNFKMSAGDSKRQYDGTVERSGSYCDCGAELCKVNDPFCDYICPVCGTPYYRKI